MTTISIEVLAFQRFYEEASDILTRKELNICYVWFHVQQMWNALTPEERIQWQLKVQGLTVPVKPRVLSITRGFIAFYKRAITVVRGVIDNRIQIETISIMWNRLTVGEQQLWVDHALGQNNDKLASPVIPDVLPPVPLVVRYYVDE